MKTTIELAREVKLPYDFVTGEPINLEKLEAFAALIREEATAEANAKSNASWAMMCEKMVAIEREACAKLLLNTDLGGLKNNPSAQKFIAELLCAYVDAIKARGQA
jgi:hypothetical protein